jgi:glycosyltransferase involved in cell wall biosynthesis
VRYADDANTRYQFAPNPNITIHFKSDIDIENIVRQTGLKGIVLSSWRDSTYTAFCKKYVSEIPVIMALDNPYKGTLKQKFLGMFSAILVKRFCNKVWVAGAGQYEYARRLGFADSDIMFDLYAADTSFFYRSVQADLEQKSQTYPKTLVYVGRLVAYKNAMMLARIFNSIVAEKDFKWKLIIAGEGPLKKEILNEQFRHVNVMDFIAPKELPTFYSQAGAFCLPSNGEHWGVAVHEAAAAGLPLLLSDSVESAKKFLIDKFNGYKFKTADEGSLRESLIQLMTCSDNSLLEMSKNSLALSERISHETWSASLFSVIK